MQASHEAELQTAKSQLSNLSEQLDAIQSAACRQAVLQEKLQKAEAACLGKDQMIANLRCVCLFK